MNFVWKMEGQTEWTIRTKETVSDFDLKVYCFTMYWQLVHPWCYRLMQVNRCFVLWCSNEGLNNIILPHRIHPSHAVPWTLLNPLSLASISNYQSWKPKHMSRSQWLKSKIPPAQFVSIPCCFWTIKDCSANIFLTQESFAFGLSFAWYSPLCLYQAADELMPFPPSSFTDSPFSSSSFRGETLVALEDISCLLLSWPLQDFENTRSNSHASKIKRELYSLPSTLQFNIVMNCSGTANMVSSWSPLQHCCCMLLRQLSNLTHCFTICLVRIYV